MGRIAQLCELSPLEQPVPVQIYDRHRKAADIMELWAKGNRETEEKTQRKENGLFLISLYAA